MRVKLGREVYLREELPKFLLDYGSLKAKLESELDQDLFVISVVGKSDGFFVDIGAADGFSVSNTKLLEDMGWKGILVEPSKYWHSILQNRLDRSHIVLFLKLYPEKIFWKPLILLSPLYMRP